MCQLQDKDVLRDQRIPIITAAPVAGLLLRLMLGCDDAGERLQTLTALHRLFGACRLLGFRM